ncbi:ADP-ribosylation factor-like protein [Candidatus Albibeggiatoa sp. nov. NOAA]|uniref:ADP-ribosylation factor-like protein n=1 Tax=Candidatus Albibeggiatoa sp. nov. NOAA TaxID=3162724 RepID=UPI0032F41400|nr:ADP-ribosylation factor-like protein [Thiotrichaceae bacterium]
MAIIDTEKNVVVIRIVFDGAPLSGKTTTIYALRDALAPNSDVFPPNGDADTTAYFDWLTYTGGQFQQMPITCQIVSTPSAPESRARREYLLSTADVVMFVVDATNTEQQTALEYYTDVQAYQTEQAFKVLILANKQDQKNVINDELAHLYQSDDPDIKMMQTSAVKNKGIREAFVLAVRLASERLETLLDQQDDSLIQQPSETTAEALLEVMQQLECDETSDISLSTSELEALADLDHEPVLDAETPVTSNPNLTDTQIEALADLDDEAILPDVDNSVSESELAAFAETDLPTQDLDDDLTAIVDLPENAIENIAYTELPIDLDSNDDLAAIADLPEDSIEENLSNIENVVDAELPADLDNDLAAIVDLPEDSIEEGLSNIENVADAELSADLDNDLAAIADLPEDSIEEDLSNIENIADTELPADLDNDLAAIADLPEDSIEEDLSNIENITDVTNSEPTKAQRLPRFPDEETPYQWVYPPLLGRNILAKPDFQGGLRPNLDDETWMIHVDGQWRCFSNLQWEYPTEQAARQALREQTAWHVQCNPLLMKQRCVAIAQERKTWRLWQITQAPTHLADQLTEALLLTDVNQLVVETFTCATNYLDAYQELAQLPFEFQIQLDNIEVHDKHIAYLGVIYGERSEPITDSHLGSNEAIKQVLKQNFAPIVQQAVRTEDLDVETIVSELEAVQAQDDNLIVVEALTELFVDAI